MDATNGTNSKTEQVNQLVRAGCVILLLLSFCAAYLYGVWTHTTIVGSDAFIGVLTLAMTWFFKSRDEQQRKTDMTSTTKTTDTDPSGATREVTTTGPLGVTAAPPVATPPPTTPGGPIR